MKPYKQPPPSQTTRPMYTASPNIQNNASSSRIHFVGWGLLPLRLFLGMTFCYAGIQKLTDPQFFHKSTPGYIGNQIIAFAHGSPLHDLLIRLALPHALLFGLAIALGEIAIGLGALVGFLFRPAAFFGLLLSILFFLSASWHVYPYFYGSDIVFAFCWLTFLLNGPRNTGLPSVDSWLFQGELAQRQGQIARWLFIFFVGGPGLLTLQENQAPSNTAQGRGRGLSKAQRAQDTRRGFVWGLLTGGGSIVLLGFLGYALGLFGNANNDNSPANSGSPSTPTAATSDTSTPQANTPTTSGSTGSSNVIAQVSAVPKNSSTPFTLPSNGDPGILVHLPDGNFVAYDATCTHAGCPVDYDPNSQHLLCPCHGAVYDPAHAAVVLGGPTVTPLTAVTIHVDSATGAITL